MIVCDRRATRTRIDRAIFDSIGVSRSVPAAGSQGKTLELIHRNAAIDWAPLSPEIREIRSIIDASSTREETNRYFNGLSVAALAPPQKDARTESSSSYFSSTRPPFLFPSFRANLYRIGSSFRGNTFARRLEASGPNEKAGKSVETGERSVKRNEKFPGRARRTARLESRELLFDPASVASGRPCGFRLFDRSFATRRSTSAR